VALTRDDLQHLVKPARTYTAALADAIDYFAMSISAHEDGAAVKVPESVTKYHRPLNDLILDLRVSRQREDVAALASELLELSGQTGRLRKDGKVGVTLLSYRNTLPDDLFPLLVLDASGRVRQTYNDIERYRGNLVRLKAAVKDYAPLTVHVWRTSGSKTAFGKRSYDLAMGIANTIQARPNEKWLVVAHKRSGRVGDIGAQVVSRLPVEVRDNVSVVTWGNHMATNAFVDVTNVILAGTLFMRPSLYTALTHLAAGCANCRPRDGQHEPHAAARARARQAEGLHPPDARDDCGCDRREPLGWSSPSVYSNGDTLEAVAGEGIVYTLDQMDSDIIQRLEPPEAPLVLLPYPVVTVDMGQELARMKGPAEIGAIWLDYVGGPPYDPRCRPHTKHAGEMGQHRRLP
jgi:hypothetical protein